MMMRALKTIENYIPGRTVKAGESFDAASAVRRPRLGACRAGGIRRRRAAQEKEQI